MMSGHVLNSLRIAILVALPALMMVMPRSVTAQGYRGPTRVNFDERLIKGQTSKAGSVYIFDRQQSNVRSLVQRKRRFRHKILRTVFED